MRMGRFASRSDAVRCAVRELLRGKLWSPGPYQSRRRREAVVKVAVVKLERAEC